MGWVRAILSEPAGKVDTMGGEVFAKQELAPSAVEARHAGFRIVGADTVADLQGLRVVVVCCGPEGDDGTDGFVTGDQGELEKSLDVFDRGRAA